MSNTQDTKGGKLVPFPLQKGAAWETALRAALLETLRKDPVRQSAAAAGADHEAIEAHLRTSETRRHLSASTKSRLIELIPAAITKLSEAIEKRESWAIKLLLDAAGFERIASRILEDAPEGAHPVISTDFEHKMIESMLTALRNPTASQPAEEADTRKE